MHLLNGICLLSLLNFTACTVVPSGHVGVITSFGAIQEGQVESGLSAMAPWKSCDKMNVRTQESQEAATVPTSEGLTVALEASILYHLDPAHAVAVFRELGPGYHDVFMAPQIRSALRGATVKYQAKDLYTSNRAEIENEIEKQIQESMGQHGIVIEKVLLRNIKLPEKLTAAIDAKLAADQQAQQMEFTILKEKKEAERKAIEAQGIAKAQEIIHSTLTDNYLKYAWIQSLEKCAEHKNAIIYIPTGHDGMPLFSPVRDTNIHHGGK